MYTTVLNKRIFEEVLDQMKMLIRAGKLKPGDKLPPERELATTLGVSRPSLREALRLLESLGAVRSKPGEGTTLQQPRLDQVFLTLGAFLFIDDYTFYAVYEVRSMLEGQTTNLAAQRATEVDVKRIIQWGQRLQTTSDTESLAHADLQFHYSIAVASHNPVLSSLWEIFSGLFGETMYKARMEIFANSSDLVQLSLQHDNIVKAILKHDELAAQKAMMDHLQFAVNKIEGSNKRK